MTCSGASESMTCWWAAARTPLMISVPPGASTLRKCADNGVQRRRTDIDVHCVRRRVRRSDRDRSSGDVDGHGMRCAEEHGADGQHARAAPHVENATARTHPASSRAQGQLGGRMIAHAERGAGFDDDDAGIGRLEADPCRADHQIGVHPRRGGEPTPGVGKCVGDLHEPPWPRQIDLVCLANRCPELDAVLLGAFLDGDHPQAPQRVTGELDILGSDRDHQLAHSSADATELGGIRRCSLQVRLHTTFDVFRVCSTRFDHGR